MPKNTDMYEVCKEVMMQVLELHGLPETDLEHMAVAMDEPHMMMVSLHNANAYAYDFRQDNGRVEFEESLKTTKLLSGKPHCEVYYNSGTLSQEEGIVEEIVCGWYLTFFQQ